MPETNETALEKTFADLAYASLRDKASALLDYLIGFQMLQNEEDGKRAVGIFGFEIDNKVYYVPVFFLGGEIRGLESIYSEDSDLFMPLSESWINSIINKRQVEVGDNDQRDRDERGVRVPSYTRLKTLPSSNGAINMKLGAAKLLKQREYDGVIDLPEALREANATAMFKEAIFKQPRLREAFEQFYNVMDLTAAEPQVKAAAEVPITIVGSQTADAVSDLTDEQRSKIMEGGTVILDNRPEITKSIVYSTESRRPLENPTDGGLYDVLWGDGTVGPAFVLNTANEMPTVFVIRLDDDKHCTIDPRQVFVLRQYMPTEYANELDKYGKKPSDVKPGDVAVFASFSGETSDGFCIRQNDKGIGDTVVLTPNDHYCATAKGGMYDSAPIGYGQAPARRSWHRSNPNDRVTRIVVGGYGSKEPIFTENKLVVNDKSFRALIVNHASFAVEQDGVDETYTDKKPDAILHEGDFGDLSTVTRSLEKTSQAVKFWKTGNQINITDQHGTHTLGKIAALKYMLVNHACGEQDARLVSDGARSDVSVVQVKYAEGFEGLPPFPPDDIDETYGNEMNALFPGQIPISLRMPQTPKDNREFYMYQSPFGGGGHEGNGIGGGTSTGQSPLSQAQDAARTGQKEVFDASVMGSLLKSHAPTELVDRFLPTIITGMDRLGRILFLVMWHYDEFEERYGENDISEMLDSLKSSFEGIGDLVMFLQKRSLSGDPDSYGVGVGQTAIESADN